MPSQQFVRKVYGFFSKVAEKFALKTLVRSKKSQAEMLWVEITMKKRTGHVGQLEFFERRLQIKWPQFQGGGLILENQTVIFTK